MSVRRRDPRKTFGAALTAVAASHDSIISLSVDSGLSSGLGEFRSRFPDRYIELGIMEQGATGIAAGLATAGLIPVLSAIAPFVTARNFEMFRNDLGYMRQNVKIVGRNAGLSYAPLGPTHHSVDDIALTRMIPGIVVIAPQDCGEIESAVAAMIEHEGPVYLRIGAGAIPDLFDDEPFVIGRGRHIAAGSDVTIVSTGQMTAAAIEVAESLADEGISVDLWGMPTVNPLDDEAIVESAARTGAVVTIEEHYERGGLGAAVAEVLSSRLPTPVLPIGVPHRFMSSGPYDDVLAASGLSADAMTDRIRAWLSR